MSAHKDDTRPATTADDEFAALMAASSLRAPRVRALDETIPEDARRRLCAAVDAAPTGSARHVRADEPDKPEEPDEPSSVSGNNGDDEHTRPDDASGVHAVRSGPAALHGAPLRVRTDRPPAFISFSHGRTEVGTPWRESFTTRVTRPWPYLQESSLLSPHPPGDRRMRDLWTDGRHVTGSAPRRDWDELCRADIVIVVLGHTPPVPPLPEAHLIIHHEVRRLADAPSAPESRWVLEPAVGPAGPLAPEQPWWNRPFMTLRHAHPLVVHTAGTRWPSRPPWAKTWGEDRTRALALCPHLAVPQDTGAAFGSVVTSCGGGSGGMSTGGRRPPAAACLTELLHVPWTSTVHVLCPWRPGEEEPRPWAPGPGFSSHGAAGPPSVAGRTVLADATRSGADVPMDTGTGEVCLLVAVGPAVGPHPVHRSAVLLRLPLLPPLDGYAPRPGSGLLLPRTTTEGAAGRRRQEGQHTVAAAAGRLRLWRRQAGDGLEQHARFSMRAHLTEQDTGQRLPVRLTYRTADPHAITAVFNHGTDDEREWVFAHELLVDGMHESVGIGDVIVWPSQDEEHGRRRVFVRLRSPEGTALLSAARDDVDAFLDAVRPLTLRPSAALYARALDAWERELAEFICPGPGDR
ncbi:SsgA family sporulation/cell division regulator [Streptomyces sp. NPDC000931]|uniref:SsgA family sporulation/cell division regulator n=1 Tax=Streptomyces sp. NPDC000931 TaxID=3154372 RepID=UPI00331BCABA